MNQELRNERIENGAKNLIKESLIEVEMANINFMTNRLLSYCESPIEQVLLAGVVLQARYDNLQVVAPGCQTSDSTGERIIILPQHKVDKYRSDFLLRLEQDILCFETKTTKGKMACEVYVECDGHEYHERTKEQAKRDRQRDRYFTTCGLNFLRFTGSEIMSEPGYCIEQIFQFFKLNMVAQ